MKPLYRNPMALAVAAAISSTFTANTILAQDDTDDASLEEVMVTGSRIAKQDFVSNSPVATVDREQFVLTNTINTESLLNSLPQTVPGFDRTSNNPGDGTATVDLRGLGANRTLVLMNGKRVTPTSSSGVVDINSIPASLIKSVEVLTGGASSVYGSDAVAGVVNFILRDDFEGVELNMSTEQTEKGDAGLSTIDLTIGGNFAEGRGNAVMNVQWTDREDLFQGDRGFSTFAQFDDVDDSGNPILIDGGSSGIPGTSIFAGGFSGYSPSSGVTFDPNGAIRPFRTSGDNDFYNYAPVNYIQLPQERYQATALASFEMSDHIEIYTQTMFTSSSVPQQLAPTPIFQVSEFTIDGNPFLTPESQQVLSDALGGDVDANGNGIADTGTGFLRRRLLEVGPRVSDSKFTSFQFQVGAKGSITDSWNYDAYYQFGQVDSSETQLGNVNRDRFSQALLVDTSDPQAARVQMLPRTALPVLVPPSTFGVRAISPRKARNSCALRYLPLRFTSNRSWGFRSRVICLSYRLARWVSPQVLSASTMTSDSVLHRTWLRARLPVLMARQRYQVRMTKALSLQRRTFQFCAMPRSPRFWMSVCQGVGLISLPWAA